MANSVCDYLGVNDIDNKLKDKSVSDYQDIHQIDHKLLRFGTNCNICKKSLWLNKDSFKKSNSEFRCGDELQIRRCLCLNGYEIVIDVDEFDFGDHGNALYVYVANTEFITCHLKCYRDTVLYNLKYRSIGGRRSVRHPLAIYPCS